jgi:hypothetical protein
MAAVGGWGSAQAARARTDAMIAGAVRRRYFQDVMVGLSHFGSDAAAEEPSGVHDPHAKGLRRRRHPAISREAEAKKLSCLFRHTFLTAHIPRLNPELMRVFPYLVVCMEVPEPR